MKDLQIGKTVMVVDDDDWVLSTLKAMMEDQGFTVLTALDSDGLFVLLRAVKPDLLLIDLNLPGVDGNQICKRIRDSLEDSYFPILMMSGTHSKKAVIDGLDSGANHFIGKPFDRDELMARVRSLLSVKQVYDKAELKIEKQLRQVTHLKKFLSPQVADEIVSAQKHDSLKRGHRKNITVTFVDLRGFTSFAESQDPTRVSEVLTQYYHAVGTEALMHEGTVGSLLGDGMLIFFNDPISIAEHTQRALEFALSVREKITELRRQWISQGIELHFGMGLASGETTIGIVGFDQYWDYTVIGKVPNLAARLCHQAGPNQILISRKCLDHLLKDFRVENVGMIPLKGLQQSVETFNVLAKNEAQQQK